MVAALACLLNQRFIGCRVALIVEVKNVEIQSTAPAEGSLKLSLSRGVHQQVLVALAKTAAIAPFLKQRLVLLPLIVCALKFLRPLAQVILKEGWRVCNHVVLPIASFRASVLHI